MFMNQLFNTNYKHTLHWMHVGFERTPRKPRNWWNKLIDAIEFNTEIPRTHNDINIANNIVELGKEEGKKKRGQAVLLIRDEEIIQGKIHRKPRPQDNSRIIIKHLVNEIVDGEPTSILQLCKQCHLSEETQTQKAKYNQTGKVKNCIISAEAKELKLLPITEVYYSSRKRAEKKRRTCSKNSPESTSIYLNEMFIAERINIENKAMQETKRIKNLNRNIIFAPETTSQVIRDIESSLEEFDNFEIYTDGSLKGNRKKTKTRDTDILTTDIKRMGIGIVIYFTTPNQETYSKSIGTRVTGTSLSTRAELLAILLAIKMLTFSILAVIKTDSQASIDAIKNFDNNRRQKAWKRYKNPYILQIIIKLTKEKKLTIVYCKIKAHNGDYKNEEADKLAKRGALQNLPIKEIIKISTKVKRQTKWALLNRTAKWNNKNIQRETDWKLSFRSIHESSITNLLTTNEDQKKRKFSLKLLNNELPTKTLLHERQLDLYENDTCVFYNQCQEDSLHVFVCNDFINILQKQFINRIIAQIVRIKGDSKRQLIGNLITNSSIVKIDILRQIQNYNQQSRFSFIDIIRGLIPKQLKKILTKIIKNTEAIEIINKTFLNLRDKKWEQWLKRCDEFLKWEKERNITKEAKKIYKKRVKFITDEYKKLKKNLLDSCHIIINNILDNIFIQGHGLHDLFYNIDECGVLTSSETTPTTATASTTATSPTTATFPTIVTTSIIATMIAITQIILNPNNCYVKITEDIIKKKYKENLFCNSSDESENVSLPLSPSLAPRNESRKNKKSRIEKEITFLPLEKM
ncbi:hypothetical protein Glove_301g46 [Diversispora epigaea]|uniref:ribonuclease H n=1 Tax=Diversispora epigaea TaxID=1348612 RepID=A0A397I3J8_9GLOM|nr:hypothetical protein Glove_301g46 [Diversispora epigaea]